MSINTRGWNTFKWKIYESFISRMRIKVKGRARCTRAKKIYKKIVEKIFMKY